MRVGKYGWFRIAAPCPAQAKLRRLLRRGHAQAAEHHRDAALGRALVRDRLTFDRQTRSPVTAHRRRPARPWGSTAG